MHGRLKTAVEKQADAAALVEIVRECQTAGLPLPEWVPPALESLLTDFVNLTKSRHAGRWARWARQWFRRYLDAQIAGHLLSNREEYGLTWDEALDEASDWFSGTPAANSPEALMAAYKRDRKRGPMRPSTHWEEIVTKHLRLHARPVRRHSWWSANADRLGPERGEWLQRPRLLKPQRGVK